MKYRTLTKVILIGLFTLIGAQGTHANTAFSNDEQAVREYFSDIPVMIEIARCESGLRHFTNSGDVLVGSDGVTIGAFQIYERIHSPAAQALGHNLRTLDGNLGYAKHLYLSEGTQPWSASRSCWERALREVENASRDFTEDEILIELLKQKVALLTKLIEILQKQEVS